MAHTFPRRPRQSKGAALIIALAFLLIVTALAVSFLSSISGETFSSSAQANSVNVRQLADSVPQIAISRIREATSGLTDPSDPGSPAVSWASQPGMIRTYTSTGSPGTFYRLYSASSDSVPGSSFKPGDELPPVNWNKQKGVYVDLNSPVIRTESGGNQSLEFPIVDPRAQTGAAATSIEGFNYTSGTINGIVGPGGSPNDQRLPMPVRWLYVLANGQLLHPDDSTSGTITFTGPVQPSKSNPIVGRIAYWVDDESSKVNINTASEATYYDLPHYSGAPDFVLSMFSPTVNEFQRYPGHPSNTALSTVLKPWIPSINDVPITYDTNYKPAGMSAATTRIAPSAADEISTRLKRYLKLTPRYRFGGTEGGTVITTMTSGAVAPLAQKTERLYSSVDEMLYAPDLAGSDPSITNDVLERARFFLTANNRAPEVNLFGLPRVAIWPIHKTDDSDHRTAQDRLIARCATLGSASGSSNSYPFYFQRYDSKSTSNDYQGIPRNQRLYSYLQDITSRNIPGFGGNFASKYGSGERDQILTEIFDYIRSCNLNDPNLPTSGTYSDSYKIGGTWYSPSTSPYRSPGLVVPIKISDTKGAGRFPVIDQAFLVFYCVGIPTTPPSGQAKDTETKFRAALYFNFMNAMQGFMVSFTNLQLTVTATNTFTCFPVADADPAKSASLVSGQPNEPFNFFKNGSTVTQWANANERAMGQGNRRNFGGNHSYSALADHAISESDARRRFELVSAATPVIRGDPVKARWNLKGGTFDVTLRSADGETIQTYTFNFPDVAKLPIPRPVVRGNYNAQGTLLGYQQAAPDIDGAGGKAQNNGVLLIDNRDVNPTDPLKTVTSTDYGDVVRSVQLVDKTSSGDYVGGDFRRLSYMANVPASWFSKHKDYDGEARRAHGLRDGNGNPMPDATRGGNLVPNINWAVDSPPNVWNNEPSYYPFVRGEINGVYASTTGSPSDAPGDWNNGFGRSPDGAYLNKADEGLAYSSAGGGVPYFDWDGYPPDKNITSPNKQLPSPGMFGSLPTGTTKGASWQTLLFRPDPTGKHFGAQSPADHLLLDLFWMPIVEPYAISEPFSTAGKINMNYQIMPFSYITRETGMRAVLASERMLAITGKSGAKTTSKSSWNAATNPDQRFKINADETLKGFSKRFTAGDIFRSASEICSIDLVPGDTTDSSATSGTMKTYWENHMLTGDNVRERPYTTIYPRVTTKSNVFTVHFIVQNLKKIPSTPVDQWVEGKDIVAGEYRGSAMIERYIDPEDPAIVDFATQSSQSVEGLYRWRVANVKRFTP
ncbi:Verru_Chthon cassette protein A [Terrimicrobium sacchariphilum]|uniref:Verru_Chthon cassette protein A n=1 Tax=Terrimicrobium sacchariphilum TaxID=690879 RepID=A0A146G5K8_TERSA|nr:Verru_Chthon cassette protein A [Terrimicrobium sacchariphilum]GAT32257.1 Verru_Chthon cassette protein A [Terrimicrobium sacchariphilum]